MASTAVPVRGPPSGVVRSGSSSGCVQLVQPGPQVHSPALQQPGGKAEPDGGVVVAAGQHHLRPGAGQPHQRVVEQAARRRRPAARGRRRRRRSGRRRPTLSRTTPTSWSMKARWASSMPTPWNDRPRCQSEVCNNRMFLRYRLPPTVLRTGPPRRRGDRRYLPRFRRRSRGPRRRPGRRRHGRAARASPAPPPSDSSASSRPSAVVNRSSSASGVVHRGRSGSPEAGPATARVPGETAEHQARQWRHPPAGPPRRATAGPARPGC